MITVTTVPVLTGVDGIVVVKPEPTTVDSSVNVVPKVGNGITEGNISEAACTPNEIGSVITIPSNIMKRTGIIAGKATPVTNNKGYRHTTNNSYYVHSKNLNLKLSIVVM